MSMKSVKAKVNNFKTGLMLGAISGANMAMGIMPVSAGSFSNSSVNINPNTSPEQAMGAVIGVILTVMRYVGVAMVVYGVYEIIMSIQNNQPEAKTKGIIMALSGVVMIGLKTVLTQFGIQINQTT